MLTAAYLLNRSPHTGRSAILEGTISQSLRVIGARAFVHHERYRKKLDDRALKASYVVSASTARPTGY